MMEKKARLLIIAFLMLLIGGLILTKTYKNVIQEGIGKRYGGKGKLIRESNFKNRTRDNIEEFYDENGKLLSTSEIYSDGETGIKFYDEEGYVVSLKVYDEKGKIVFEEIFNNETGESSETRYKDGKPREMRIARDNIVLEIKKYDKNGKLLIETEDVFQLIPPVDVISADTIKDGGSISVSLQDNSGKVLFLCLETPWNHPRSIYVGEVSYTLPRAKKIEQGSESEKLILKLLEDWVRKNTSQRPRSVYDVDPQLITEIIEVLKNR
jgi:antitoxin component YwqK of YwqJK toxin-antitoxin module